MSAHTPMAVAAAKALCRRGAEQCGVDADDSWKIYGEDWLADAATMLDACGAAELLEALQAWLVADQALGRIALMDCDGDEHELLLSQAEDAEQAAKDKARAAIARATGAAS